MLRLPAETDDVAQGNRGGGMMEIDQLVQPEALKGQPLQPEKDPGQQDYQQ